MRSRLGSMPTAQYSLKFSHACASRRALCRKLRMTIGRKTFSSKLPIEPPTLIATSLPNTWQHTIVIDSDCVGIHLARHDRAARLVLRES